MKRIAIVVGTRPEVIKTAPVIQALQRRVDTEPILISTGQHRQLLERTLNALRLEPAFQLDVMKSNQTPSQVLSRILATLPDVLESTRPNAVLVQGDTSSTFAAAVTAFHLGIPVGHIEAGLRTHDLASPFPEEGYRQMTARISTWCFAPTERAAQDLRSEQIPVEKIHVTGNTVVDAILQVLSQAPPPEPAPEQDFVLMTLHRRESFGAPMRDILLGVEDFLENQKNARVVWARHPNPAIREMLVKEDLQGLDRFRCVPPLEFPAFVQLLSACRVVLTDSGGIQEEAPSLGKRVLIARETTERPEAVDRGLNRLIGRSRQGVFEALVRTWKEEPYHGPLPAPNPYGDGKAADRIVRLLTR